ncbi:MAG: hypothetical protein BWK80_01310 [Desulfobacteraceae bacterium IS3]|nr:MAG: hypothetical protein BWK80_01310 [Desulfobacteraceae bacterium IS3]
MKKVVKYVFCLWVVSLLINAPLPVFAEEASDQTAKAQPEGDAGKEKKDLGEWWNRNPLTYTPVPDEFLYHLEATYDWSRQTGNFTNDKHDLSALLTLRKNIFTYNARYSLDKRNASRPYSPPYQDDNKTLRKSTKHEIHNDFRLALTDRLIASVGMFWLKDDYIKIENRYTYYGGLGYTVFKHPRLKIDVFGAYGYEEMDHTDEYHENYLKMQDWGETDDVKYDSGTVVSSLIYLHENARAYVLPGVALNQSIDYYRDIDDSDIYRWKFNVGLDIMIMEHIFASLTYKEEYDNSPESIMGIRKRDTSIGAGVKISF